MGRSCPESLVQPVPTGREATLAPGRRARWPPPTPGLHLAPQPGGPPPVLLPAGVPAARAASTREVRRGLAAAFVLRGRRGLHVCVRDRGFRANKHSQDLSPAPQTGRSALTAAPCPGRTRAPPREAAQARGLGPSVEPATGPLPDPPASPRRVAQTRPWASLPCAAGHSPPSTSQAFFSQARVGRTSGGMPGDPSPGGVVPAGSGRPGGAKAWLRGPPPGRELGGRREAGSAPAGGRAAPLRKMNPSAGLLGAGVGVPAERAGKNKGGALGQGGQPAGSGAHPR